jgi:hypothetical protein
MHTYFVDLIITFLPLFDQLCLLFMCVMKGQFSQCIHIMLKFAPHLRSIIETHLSEY